MSVQNRQDQSNKPFILDSGLAVTKGSGILLTDGGRATPLLFGTLLAEISATGKLVPYSDETAVDGTATPAGIYIGNDIPAADIVAGDIEDLQYLKGCSVLIDKEQLVIENAKTISTVIGAGSVGAKTVEKSMNELGIFLGSSENITEFEN